MNPLTPDPTLPTRYFGKRRRPSPRSLRGKPRRMHLNSPRADGTAPSSTPTSRHEQSHSGTLINTQNSHQAKVQGRTPPESQPTEPLLRAESTESAQGHGGTSPKLSNQGSGLSLASARAAVEGGTRPRVRTENLHPAKVHDGTLINNPNSHPEKVQGGTPPKLSNQNSGLFLASPPAKVQGDTPANYRTKELLLDAESTATDNNLSAPPEKVDGGTPPNYRTKEPPPNPQPKETQPEEEPVTRLFYQTVRQSPRFTRVEFLNSHGEVVGYGNSTQSREHAVRTFKAYHAQAQATSTLLRDVAHGTATRLPRTTYTDLGHALSYGVTE